MKAKILLSVICVEAIIIFYTENKVTMKMKLSILFLFSLFFEQDKLYAIPKPEYKSCS